MSQNEDESQHQKERNSFSMGWSNEVALEFLELYKQEQILWDPKHPLHRNRAEVAYAWERIQTALSIHVSIEDLKKKKESLMTSFRSHLHKRKSRESYQPNWYAFKLMESFLGVKYECDSTNYLDSEFFGPNSSYLQSSDTKVKQKPSSGSSSQAQTFKIRTADPSIEIPDILYVKKQVDEAVTSLKRVTTETNNQQKRDQDEYDLYGQLLAKKMRKLDEHQRDLVMHEIDEIMFRAKMKSDPLRRRSTSPPQKKGLSSVYLPMEQNQTVYEETIAYHEHSGIHPTSEN